MDEQHEIVVEVERRLAVTRRTAAEIDVQIVREGRLRQSILKRAFEGKLVPQDLNDEPTTVFLDCIRAWRTGRAAAPSPRRPTRRAASRAT